MTDIILESSRVIILSLLFGYIWRMKLRAGIETTFKGWPFIFTGFSLILFGSLLDLSDNFTQLNKFVILGDTQAEAILEKAVGYTGGIFALVIGFASWFKGEMAPRLQALEVGLEVSESKFRNFYNNTPIMMHTVDTDGKLVSVNAFWLKHLGYENDEVIGRPLVSFLTEKSRSFVQSLAFQNSLCKGESTKAELQFMCKNGSIVEVVQSCTADVDASGTVVRSNCVAFDVTKEHHMQRHIQKKTYFDSLTGLPNRFLALDRLDIAIKLAQREKSKVALMVVDLDDFKSVNESLGQDVGDRLLVETSQRLQACVRDSDTVAHQSGDEYLVMLNDLPTVTEAEPIVDKIMNSISQPFMINQHEIYISSSIGLTIGPDDGDESTALLRNAGIALSRAKQNGRNTFRFFTPSMNDEAAERLKMEQLLRHALENGELNVHYQPLVNAQSQRLIGAEALIRWTSPQLGNVSPADFIPLAEKTGLIQPIGEWVLRTACDQAQTWRKRGLSDFHIAVNVSPRQFDGSDFVDIVFSALKEANLPPTNLEIEVTEGLFLGQQNKIIGPIADFHDKGIRLSMDDFGTGYSSISYLKKFPFDVLKIDQSFVSGVVDNADDQTLVASIAAMAHGLGLTIIGEGIETKGQADFLKQENCHILQGYYFSKPVPADMFDEYVENKGFSMN